MSSYMGDITNRLTGTSAERGGLDTSGKSDEARSSLDMTDFLTLMVTELTNQTIDSTANTSDMLNQMVMMQMVTALTNMTDASIMGYAASLVGKEVTVGYYDSEGNLQEIVGEVTGTGTMGGQQVVFVGDKYYFLNEIMAVGRLPEVEDAEGAEGGENGGADGTGGVQPGAGAEGSGSNGTGQSTNPGNAPTI